MYFKTLFWKLKNTFEVKSFILCIIFNALQFYVKKPDLSKSALPFSTIQDLVAWVSSVRYAEERRDDSLTILCDGGGDAVVEGATVNVALPLPFNGHWYCHIYNHNYGTCTVSSQNILHINKTYSCWLLQMYCSWVATVLVKATKKNSDASMSSWV